jgi:hypothetical protein
LSGKVRRHGRRRQGRERVAEIACYLVRPEEAIVRRSDVATVVAFIEANDERFWDPDVLERLSQVLGDEE